MLRHQCSASSAAPSTTAPVTVDTSRAAGRLRAQMPARLASSSSRIGSIALEWKAKSRSSGRNHRSRLRASAPSRSISSPEPDKRHRMRGVERGDLGGAVELGEKVARRIARRAPAPPSARRLGCAAGCGCGRRRRARHPRSDSAPAPQAAAISPTLCPRNPEAVTPSLAQRLDDADLDREQQRLGDIGARHRSAVDAAGDQLGDRPAELRAQYAVDLLDRAAESRRWRAIAARPISGNCAPLPEKTKASFRAADGGSGDKIRRRSGRRESSRAGWHRRPGRRRGRPADADGGRARGRQRAPPRTAGRPAGRRGCRASRGRVRAARLLRPPRSAAAGSARAARGLSSRRGAARRGRHARWSRRTRTN